MLYDCIIIGGGASGLFCSATFDQKIKGLILENSSRPGRKLLMSGSGKCNITHSGSIKDFPPLYGKNGGLIRGCLYKYNNLHLQNFLAEGGVKTFTREDGKVFPVSQSAQEILDFLLKKATENGFSLHTESTVQEISQKETFWQVKTKKETYLCKNLVIACGGCSYPATGSDGSIFSVLKRDLGLTITPLRPALSPVRPKDYPYKSLSGISFEEAGITIWRNEKKIAESKGSLLFTHDTLSGPLILNLSKLITKNDKIVLNYLYPCEKKFILERINHAAKNSKMSLQNLIAREFQLPKSFVQVILSHTGDKLSQIAHRLTADTFLVDEVLGYSRAMVTSGGISLSCLDPKTMGIKDKPGLYAIGEVLDIDGPTGGYNLQFAYSSANAARNSIMTNLGGENGI